MTTRLFALARLECIRLIASSRWLFAAVVWFVVAWDGASPFERNAIVFGAREWSGWDLHAAAIDTFMGVVLLLLPAFVIVCCDGLARDRASRYAHVVVPRSDDRRSWWSAKVIAIVLASLMFQLGFLGTCLAVGAVKGASLSTASTSAGRFDFERNTAGDGMEADPAFPPVHPGENMGVRQGLRALYLTLAFAAIGIALTAGSVRVEYVWFPAAAAIALALGDWVMNRFLKEAYYRVSPFSRLAEASHSAAFMERPFTWAVSIALFAAIAFGSAVLGARWIIRVDL